MRKKRLNILAEKTHDKESCYILLDIINDEEVDLAKEWKTLTPVLGKQR